MSTPPYMGNHGMNSLLLNYAKIHYPETKSDFSTMFMERCIDYSSSTGFYSMINIPSWMFLVSYEKLRSKLLNNNTISSMMHLGRGVFGSDFGTVSFVIRKYHINKYMGKYRKLFVKSGAVESIEKKEKYFLEGKGEFITNQDIFNIISGNPIAYWVNEDFANIFASKNLGEISEPRVGMATADNERFLRVWREVDINNIGFNIKDRSVAIESNRKWFPITKGGEQRKWYGNNDYVVNWFNDGFDIRNFKDIKGKVRSHNYNLDYIFKPGLTWTVIGTGKTTFRYCGNGFLYSNSGYGLFSKLDIDRNYILGFLNSNVAVYLLGILAPTMGFESGYIRKLPYLESRIKKVYSIESIVEECILLARNDWDSFETSWDFKTHPLLKTLDKGQQYKLSSIFDIWEAECEQNFAQLKSNEEELNRIFIDIYGLQDELTPEVEDKDITIRKADKVRDIKSLISYAVGCMFGRYSIDADGLIYAGGEFSDKWKVDSEQCLDNNLPTTHYPLSTMKVRDIQKDEDGNIVSDSWVDVSFVPDKDNIIPITEDEYFEDDIVSRFIEFIRTVYGEENLEENLDYIADSIGRKTSESARQAIRRYFIKDFYKDHLKIYQKRPIYWMFDSGKNDGFKCLVYMHRYNDQTVAKVRTDYLHSLQRKYEAEINRQQLIVDSSDSTTKDKTVAKKKIDRINKQLEECREYDEVVAYLANEKISIDLDDGVKVNYAKFQNVNVINSKGKEVKMNLLAKI